MVPGPLEDSVKRVIWETAFGLPLPPVESEWVE